MKSTTPRSERPISRWISTPRPSCLPRLMSRAFRSPVEAGTIETLPLNQSVAAISVGMVEGRALCDLDYSEDSTAEVDANVVMTGDGGLVEVQATAERTPLSRASLDELLALAEGGIDKLREVQESTLGSLPA